LQRPTDDPSLAKLPKLPGLAVNKLRQSLAETTLGGVAAKITNSKNVQEPSLQGNGCISPTALGFTNWKVETNIPNIVIEHTEMGSISLKFILTYNKAGQPLRALAEFNPTPPPRLLLDGKEFSVPNSSDLSQLLTETAKQVTDFHLHNAEITRKMMPHQLLKEFGLNNSPSILSFSAPVFGVIAEETRLSGDSRAVSTIGTLLRKYNLLEVNRNIYIEHNPESDFLAGTDWVTNKPALNLQNLATFLSLQERGDQVFQNLVIGVAANELFHSNFGPLRSQAWEDNRPVSEFPPLADLLTQNGLQRLLTQKRSANFADIEEFLSSTAELMSFVRDDGFFYPGVPVSLANRLSVSENNRYSYDQISAALIYDVFSEVIIDDFKIISRYDLEQIFKPDLEERRDQVLFQLLESIAQQHPTAFNQFATRTESTFRELAVKLLDALDAGNYLTTQR